MLYHFALLVNSLPDMTLQWIKAVSFFVSKPVQVFRIILLAFKPEASFRCSVEQFWNLPGILDSVQYRAARNESIWVDIRGAWKFKHLVPIQFRSRQAQPPEECWIPKAMKLLKVKVYLPLKLIKIKKSHMGCRLLICENISIIFVNNYGEIPECIRSQKSELSDKRSLCCSMWTLWAVLNSTADWERLLLPEVLYFSNPKAMACSQEKNSCLEMYLLVLVKWFFLRWKTFCYMTELG